MTIDLDSFKQNIDMWVKEIQQKVNNMEDNQKSHSEVMDNVEHNYELIFELKDEIEELKQQIEELKMMQLISLKSRQITEIRPENPRFQK